MILWAIGNISNLWLYFSVFRERKRIYFIFLVQTFSLIITTAQQILFFSSNRDFKASEWHLFDIACIAMNILMMTALVQRQGLMYILSYAYFGLSLIGCYEYAQAQLLLPVSNDIYHLRAGAGVIVTILMAISVYSMKRKEINMTEEIEVPKPVVEEVPVREPVSEPKPLDTVPFPGNPHKDGN